MTDDAEFICGLCHQEGPAHFVWFVLDSAACAERKLQPETPYHALCVQVQGGVVEKDARTIWRKPWVPNRSTVRTIWRKPLDPTQ